MHRPTNLLGLNALRQRRPTLRNINEQTRERLSPLDRFAITITTRVGTMGFFLMIATWSVLWLGWNLLAPVHLRFDPPMGFVLWLFISNLIQILLMPLIMVGQNIQGRHAEARADEDFAVNQKAELEVEEIIQHLEIQTEILQRLDAANKASSSA